MAEWVSVKDRMPPSEGYYLVVRRNANQHVRSDYFNGTDFPYDEHRTVTHWQPLPAPPTSTSESGGA